MNLIKNLKTPIPYSLFPDSTKMYLINTRTAIRQELGLERQKSQHQKELYKSEINRYKAELDNKLKEIEILLLRAKIDSQAPNPNKNHTNLCTIFIRILLNTNTFTNAEVDRFGNASATSSSTSSAIGQYLENQI